jgi:hypothetical protein
MTGVTADAVAADAGRRPAGRDAITPGTATDGRLGISHTRRADGWEF